MTWNTQATHTQPPIDGRAAQSSAYGQRASAEGQTGGPMLHERLDLPLRVTIVLAVLSAMVGVCVLAPLAVSCAFIQAIGTLSSWLAFLALALALAAA